jgi:hypothetical protein
MLAVAVAEEMLLVLPVALAVGVMAVALMLELLILVVGVVGLMEPVAQAAPVSSSSRPINNEDKWKPKSIGCMESIPQCTC